MLVHILIRVVLETPAFRTLVTAVAGVPNELKAMTDRGIDGSECGGSCQRGIFSARWPSNHGLSQCILVNFYSDNPGAKVKKAAGVSTDGHCMEDMSNPA